MYIYGRNVAKEKIINGEKIDMAYVMNNFGDREIISLLKDNNIKFKYVDKFRLDKMVDGVHQGIVLNVEDIETYDLSALDDIKKQYPLIVMLDHLEDPHNFGAIIRTCEALGIDAIIIPNDRSVGINATVIKTSAGAISYIKIIKVNNLVSAINKLKNKGYWIVGTDMSSTSVDDIDYKMSVCLVIGNEGSGMSKLVKDNCDYIVSIDMEGKTNSLNASVATGIVLYKIKDARRI